MLMKHLDDSNKEAQEDAEMDAELEMEITHGLCSHKSGSPNSGQGKGAGTGGGGGRTDPEGHLCMRCYSPAQVSTPLKLLTRLQQGAVGVSWAAQLIEGLAVAESSTSG